MEDAVLKQLNEFIYTSLNFYGKEIAIDSRQLFTIEQVVNDDDLKNGIYHFSIQYGYPQSGCVSVDVCCNDSSINVEDFCVYATPEKDDNLSVVYDSQPISSSILPEMSISVNFGALLNTVEHKTIHDISMNKNAIAMLNNAVNDLQNAEILGECRAHVLMGSDRIPVCNSVSKSDIKSSFSQGF